ncbi:unnamed protein product [Symbiodinium necroappetens]|uniref:Uncharacterized protein n=1 Tax=Symbiodinium necroappetens TaxID=1628268 RepID=A0A813BHV2_9DINO|nr:unnamed protein product [Symbiodinium necroappetens]
MKVGETGYLKLADAKLDPEWRQGVVVDRSTDGALKIAVRITADEQHHCAAYFGFDAGKRHFILVAGGARQLVSACPEHHLALEMKASKLVEQASSFLQSCPADTSEEQVFATASEDLDNPKPTATRASVRTQQRPALDFEDGEDDESSSADSGSGEEDPVKVLLRAQKKLRDSTTDRGRGIAAATLDKGTKGRSRYPLLSTGSSRKKDEDHQDLKTALQQAASSTAVGSADDPLKTLLTLKVLETLKPKKKTRRRNPSSSASSLSSSSGGRDSRSAKDRGAAKALRQYHESKRRMFKRPLKHVRRYLKEVEEQLGGGDDIPYRLVDYTRKIYWGKQRTLQRVHVLLHEILRLMLQNRFEEAALQTVLSLRAVHQCSLDNGRWDLAWLLTHVEDPFQRRRWGGETQEVEVVAAYVKALEDLEKKTRQTRFFDGVQQEEEEQPDDKTSKGKPKGGKGGQKGSGESIDLLAQESGQVHPSHRNVFGREFDGALFPDMGLTPGVKYVEVHRQILADAQCMSRENTLEFGKIIPEQDLEKTTSTRSF